MAHPTIAAGYPKALLNFAVSRGAEHGALASRAGLCPDALDDPDARTLLADYLALFDAAIEATGEPALALQFGEAVRMQEISIVGLICEACEATADVGPQLNRYARLVIDDDSDRPPDLLGALFDEHGMWMVGPSDTFARHRYIAEAEVARLCCNVRDMFDGHSFFRDQPFPRAVRFTHPEPEYRSEYDRIFQSPITFNSDRNALLTDEGFLSLKQPPTNRYVFGVLSARAEALLAELETSKTTRSQVERSLMTVLHTGEIGVDRIAKNMGLSRQTLYRRLKDESVTYKEVLDELRRTMAMNFLNGKKASVNETAYLLGFSHPAAFTRAFKRWTGMSPREARRGDSTHRAAPASN